VEHRDGDEEEKGVTQPNTTRKWRRSTTPQQQLGEEGCDPNQHDEVEEERSPTQHTWQLNEAKAERPHNDRSQSIDKEGSRSRGSRREGRRDGRGRMRPTQRWKDRAMPFGFVHFSLHYMYLDPILRRIAPPHGNFIDLF